MRVSYYFLREDNSIYQKMEGRRKQAYTEQNKGKQMSVGERREDLLNLHSTQWKENRAETCNMSAISIQRFGTAVANLLFPILFNF